MTAAPLNNVTADTLDDTLVKHGDAELASEKPAGSASPALRRAGAEVGGDGELEGA